MGFDSMFFDECAQLIRDNVQPDEVAQLPYIGLEHIEAGTLHLNDYGQANDVTSTKLKFKTGDILFGKLRPYFRKVIRAPFDGVCSTDIWVVRAKPGIEQGFLYYLMASQRFVDFSMQGAEGTKMPRAKWEHVSRYEQIVFPLPEQRAIAHILGSLDDKIELNRQMNATLEGIARALFKSWFVDFDPVHVRRGESESTLPPEVLALFPDDFVESELVPIPRGWEAGTLKELVRLKNGKRPGERESEKTPELRVPLYGGGGIMGYVKEPLYTNPILLTGRVGTLGKIFRVTRPCWPSDNTIVIRPRTPFQYEYIYLLLNTLNISTLNRGSTQPLIAQRDLKQISVVIPADEIVQKFHELTEVFFDQVDANRRQSRTLAELRDTLLPRLISGELRVPERLGQD